jgi:hypothetical protein
MFVAMIYYIIITILDIARHPVFYLKQNFFVAGGSE